MLYNSVANKYSEKFERALVKNCYNGDDTAFSRI